MNGDLKSMVSSFGPNTAFAYVRWAPSNASTQTLTEAQGVRQILRSGAGVYLLYLSKACKELSVYARYIDDDTTNYHWFEPTGINLSSGLVSLRHRTGAFATADLGPSASDTVDELEVLIVQRFV